jgi:C4-dicarboxylate transporter, DctQ subunit
MEDLSKMDPLARAVNRLGLACGWLFAIATVLTCYEVVARYVFSAPTTWAHELTTSLCATAFALGGAYSMVRGEHIRITTLADNMNPLARRACLILGLLCGVIYLSGLSWAAVIEAADSVWRFEEGRWAPEPTPGPPNWPLPAFVRVMLATGALLFLLSVLRELLLTMLRKGGR